MTCSLGRTSPLSTEGSIGVATEYSSNPFLISNGVHSVEDVALLINAPVSYDLNWEHFKITPAIRYSSDGSYSSLNSNYFHLNGNASFGTDVDTLALSTGIARDSTLYQSGIKSGNYGARNDNTTAAADWQRILTARATFDLNVGWSRSLFNQEANSNGLVDYRYYSEGSSGTYAVNELTNVQVILGAGQYGALDGDTASNSYNLQLGAVRQLSELWTLTTSAGYSTSENSQKLFEGPFFFGGVEYGPYYVGTVKSSEKGPIFNASVTRQGETLNVTASASRAYRPTGFNFLSRTDVAELDITYISSDRWTFGARISYQNTGTPASGDVFRPVRYINPLLTADYHWTPTWLVSLHASYVTVNYQLPPVRANSNSVSLLITRQFLRTDL